MSLPATRRPNRIVQGLDVYLLEIPMRRFRHAAAHRRQAQSVLVNVRLSDQTGGWGETLPREYVTGETLESVQADLRGVLWPAMAGRLADQCLAQLPSRAPDGRWVLAARCAAQLALVDAVGLSGALGQADGGSDALGGLRVSGVIGSDDAARTAWLLRLMRVAGLRDFKLKLGLDEGVDAANLRAVLAQLRRPLARGRATLRVDANGGWADRPIQRIAELARMGVCVVEQPVFCSAAELVDLARRSPLPLMADESLVSPDDAAVLLSEPRVWWNIRISKNGGLDHALALARQAQGAGVSFVVGCMVGETGLLSAAQRRLLACCPRPRFVEGNYGRLLLRHDVTRPSLRWGYGGRLAALDGEGLGVRIDPIGLARWARPGARKQV